MGEILANMTQVSDVAPGPLVFDYHFSLEEVIPLHLYKLKPLPSRMICANLYDPVVHNE
jgi:hypothetical protein